MIVLHKIDTKKIKKTSKNAPDNIKLKAGKLLRRIKKGEKVPFENRGNKRRIEIDNGWILLGVFVPDENCILWNFIGNHDSYLRKLKL